MGDKAGGLPAGAPERQPQDLAGWTGEIAARLKLPFTADMTAQFLEYFRLLREWNEKINLTSVIDDEGIATRHLLDSLTVLPAVEQHRQARRAAGRFSLIDVGSGAGFPGLPLKIARPDYSVVLLDALSKRVKFLEEVIGTLSLYDIAAVHGRAEDKARGNEYRESFDVAVARAVAPMPALCEYCLPYVKVGGIFLAMKGPAETESPDSFTQVPGMLGGELDDIETFCLPGTGMRRSIVKIRKIRPTPSAYPRKAGRPEACPLV